MIGAPTKRNELTQTPKLKVGRNLEKLTPKYGSEQEYDNIMVRFFDTEGAGEKKISRATTSMASVLRAQTVRLCKHWRFGQ